MIVRYAEGNVVLFRQTDHALLSGAFAAAWGNERFHLPARYESTLVAASRHDDGWAAWELSPTVADDGRPIDFIRIPVAEHVVVYREGIDLVEREDPYAGLVVSLHGERLYTRPFHPGSSARIEYMTGDALETAQRYVAHELKRQRRLIETIPAPAPSDGVASEAEEAWRLLQVWDRLSLFVCMQPLEARNDATMPPVRCGNGDDATITVRGVAFDAMTLDPYPFREAPADFEMEALEVEGDRWPDAASFRRAYRTARRRIVRFRAEPVS